MKRELTINSIAKNNLIKRKGQYTLLILGIVLAMVFSSSVLFFYSCMNTSSNEINKRAYGRQDYICVNAPEELSAVLKSNKDVESYGFAHITGFAYKDKNSMQNGSAVAYYDESGLELAYVTFKEGRYPQNENEIAIESLQMKKLGIDAKIGDTVSLNMLVQNGNTYLDEPIEKSYTLVGIAENKKNNIISFAKIDNQYVPAIFLSSNSSVELGGKELLNAYIATDLNGVDLNLPNLYEVGKNSYIYSGTDVETPLFFAILFAIILLVASCLGIVNSFNSNLNGRKKQIGMLRTVGATKRQIVKIFGREAFIISLIAVPISIFISYFLVFGISKMLGDSFVFIPNFSVLIACAVFGIICVMLAALIPLRRATKISPVQSIRNIEYTRKMGRKRIKSQKKFETASLLAKRNILFNRKKQTVVNLILVITIICSGFGFSALNFFDNEYAQYDRPYDYNLSINGGIYQGIFDSAVYETGYTDEEINQIRQIPYVKEVYGASEAGGILLTDSISDYMNVFNCISYIVDHSYNEYSELLTPQIVDKAREFNIKQTTDIKNKNGYSQAVLPINIKVYDSSRLALLNDYVYDGRINMDKINSGEEIILIAPQKIALRLELLQMGGLEYNIDKNDEISNSKMYYANAECDIKAGDKFNLGMLKCFYNNSADDSSKDEYLQKPVREVTVGAVISELPETLESDITGYSYIPFSVITSASGYKSFSDNAKFTTVNINLNTECNEEIESEMQSFIADAIENVNAHVISKFEKTNANMQYRKALIASLIAVIILFLSISASIINNSISSRIRESKREIGTLRAVGASVKEITLSYFYQINSSLITGCAAGFVLFALLYVLVYFACKSLEMNFTLRLDLWQTILACIILFAVCSLNLWLKIKKEMKNSIIENIREL